MHVNVFEFSKLLAQSSERYLEFVRVSGFSVGIYVLDGGAMDHQKHAGPDLRDGWVDQPQTPSPGGRPCRAGPSRGSAGYSSHL